MDLLVLSWLPWCTLVSTARYLISRLLSVATRRVKLRVITLSFLVLILLLFSMSCVMLEQNTACMYRNDRVLSNV